MNKKILTLALLSILSFSYNTAFAVETVQANDQLQEGNKEEQLVDPDLQNKESSAIDKKLDIESIIDSLKDKNITVKDFDEYSSSLKNKTNEQMVSFFNEIKSTFEIMLKSKNGLVTDSIKERIEKLNKKIDESIKSINETQSDKKMEEDFKYVSHEYSQLLRDYKQQMIKAIEEKTKELKKNEGDAK